MIKIDLTTALTLYLGLVLALIVVIALLHQVKARRFVRRRRAGNLETCHFCGHHYLREEGDELVRCPRCSCLTR